MKVHKFMSACASRQCQYLFCRLHKPPDGVLHYPEAPASRARRSKLC
jgi:hypothetical protein